MPRVKKAASKSEAKKAEKPKEKTTEELVAPKITSRFVVSHENGLVVRQHNGLQHVNELTPDDARELAKALNAAADDEDEVRS